MMLTDPREALAEQSNFIGYLVGLAGVGRVVQALAADGNRRADPPETDGLVYLLLGLASLGAKIERLAEDAPARRSRATAAAPPPSTDTRWLR
jgi:hypothetical protein